MGYRAAENSYNYIHIRTQVLPLHFPSSKYVVLPLARLIYRASRVFVKNQMSRSTYAVLLDDPDRSILGTVAVRLEAATTTRLGLRVESATNDQLCGAKDSEKDKPKIFICM